MRIAISAFVVNQLALGFRPITGGEPSGSRTGFGGPIPEAISITSDSAGQGEEPAGCKEPSNDYSRVKINGFWLDERTYEMLEYAYSLYGGPIDIRGPAITQGSWSNNGPESFGTHLGGGAVDLSVIRPGGTDVLYTEIEPLIRALRTAGFAAWLREPGELGPGSPIHIHAIAIGDRELSPEAAAQLTGKYGYFRGFTGVPTDDGIPIPDHDGGLVLCSWMVQTGYRDLRQVSSQGLVGWPQPGWQLRLPLVASSFITSSEIQTVTLARSLHFLADNDEDPSNMCGPLAAAILGEAGLLPLEPGPSQNLKSYWLANPNTNGRPWSLFLSRDYQVFRFKTPVNRFDFSVWPLRAGDFVYTHAGWGTYDHMFVVTEVDGAGRAYTVTNERQSDGGFLVQRVLLYDPTQPGVGALRKDWVDNPKVGTTGLGGFEVLRRRGLSLPPGTPYEYRVEPGDTLAAMSFTFSSSVAAVMTANPGVDLTRLQAGQFLIIPVGPAGGSGS
ncbi:MAG: LysM domain-containing protein [Anaerolineales bacterium]